jgi:hypothetical protein
MQSTPQMSEIVAKIGAPKELLSTAMKNTHNQTTMKLQRVPS